MLRIIILLFFLVFSCHSSFEDPQVKKSDASVETIEKEEAIAELELNMKPLAHYLIEKAVHLFDSIVAIERFRHHRILVCEEAITILKPEWNESFCDVLRDDNREKCKSKLSIVPSYKKELCSIIIDESIRQLFDPLLVLAVIMNESSFGKIMFEDGHYFVSQDVCEQEIQKSNVTEIEDDCRRRNARRLTFRSSGNKVCAYIISEEPKGYTVDTCLAGEAGLLQLITSNYYKGRIIPGTSDVIEGDTRSERRSFINKNLEASIKIGIEELIEHRDMVSYRERFFWGNWIGIYNTGSLRRKGQWMNYAIRVLKNYATICSNEIIRNAFTKECSDLELFRYYWED